MAKFNLYPIERFSRGMLISARNLIADMPGEKPDYVILTLSGSYPPRKQKRKLLDRLPEISKQETSLEELSFTIDQLISAKWLKGVIVRISNLKLDFAKMYMLHKELTKLKQADKEIVVYAERLDLQSYYVASLADKIVMPESAELWLLGISMSKLYKKDFFEKFGIQYQKLSIKEYKSAMDDMALPKMSKADKEQLNALLDSFVQDFAETVAKTKKIEPETVISWLDQAITSAAAAKEHGLIDEILYEDELFEKKHKKLKSIKRLLKIPRPPSADKVAVITLSGAIMTGKSKRPALPIPILGQTVAGSDTIVANFRAAEADEHTKAIVFYVDSGGGSPLASDLIWREIIRIKKTKPVVAVMGFLAASGGYYVLAGADKIIAAPSTITGSIGVVLGKMVLKEFYKKQLLNVETLKRGKYADSFAAARAISKDEKVLLDRLMREIYDRFVDRVASGRGLSKDQVNEIGRGRIWSGRDALKINLIDEIGDIQLGIQRARELAKLPLSAKVYNVDTKGDFALPKLDSVDAMLAAINPLLQERVLLVPGYDFASQLSS